MARYTCFWFIVLFFGTFSHTAAVEYEYRLHTFKEVRDVEQEQGIQKLSKNNMNTFICGARNGTLAVLDTFQKAYDIQAYLQTLTFDLDNETKRAYIGAKLDNSFASNDWYGRNVQWNGEGITFIFQNNQFPWASGEPNKSGERFITINVQSGRWNNVFSPYGSIDNKPGCICQYEVTPTPTNAPTTPTPTNAPTTTPTNAPTVTSPDKTLKIDFYLIIIFTTSGFIAAVFLIFTVRAIKKSYYRGKSVRKDILDGPRVQVSSGNSWFTRTYGTDSFSTEITGISPAIERDSLGATFEYRHSMDSTQF